MKSLAVSVVAAMPFRMMQSVPCTTLVPVPYCVMEMSGITAMPVTV